MHTYIGPHRLDVQFTTTIRFDVELQSGYWPVIETDGYEYAVTNFAGYVNRAGEVQLTMARGVKRRPSGSWSAREHLLPSAYDPAEGWQVLPPAVRHVIEDAYLIAITEDIPHVLAGQELP